MMALDLYASVGYFSSKQRYHEPMKRKRNLDGQTQRLPAFAAQHRQEQGGRPGHRRSDADRSVVHLGHIAHRHQPAAPGPSRRSGDRFDMRLHFRRWYRRKYSLIILLISLVPRARTCVKEFAPRGSIVFAWSVDLSLLQGRWVVEKKWCRFFLHGWCDSWADYCKKYRPRASVVTSAKTVGHVARSLKSLFSLTSEIVHKNT